MSTFSLTQSFFLRWFQKGWLLLLPLLVFSCADDPVEPLLFGTIRGVVRDARSNQPLANVTISTTPATQALLTNDLGEFEISNAPTGRVTVTATRVDFQQSSTSVTVEDSRVVTANIALARTTSSSTLAAPNRPVPADQATGVNVDVTLEWRPVNPVRADSLKYDVTLYEGGSLNVVRRLTNTRDTTFRVTGLRYNTAYAWEVTARNSAGAAARSALWRFTTRPLPNNALLFVRDNDIYSADANNVNLVQLTSTPATEAAPRLSPLSDRIAYTSNATGQYRLYTMNRDGSDQRLVSPQVVEGYHNFGIGYCWSPDGSQLLFAQYNRLFRMNRDGSGLTLVATAPPNRNFRECDWNGQNNKIIVQTIGASVYDSEIHLLNPDGSNFVEILGNQPGRMDSPSFNPQGTRIIYTRDMDNFQDLTGRQTNAQIFTQNLDGTGVVALSAITGTNGKPVGDNDTMPRFSASGGSIIFVSGSNVNQSTQSVWRMDLDGRNRVRLLVNATQPEGVNL